MKPSPCFANMARLTRRFGRLGIVQAYSGLQLASASLEMPPLIDLPRRRLPRSSTAPRHHQFRNLALALPEARMTASLLHSVNSTPTPTPEPQQTCSMQDALLADRRTIMSDELHKGLRRQAAL